MSVPGADICAYCKRSSQGLDRLNNSAMIEMMREYDPNFSRRAKLCAVCKDRAKEKFQRRRRNEKLAEKKPNASSNDKSTSYSNQSDAVLSQSSTNQQSSSSTDASRSKGPNVAKRTTGPPTNRSSSDENRQPAGPSRAGIGIDLFLPPPTPSRRAQSSQDSSNSTPSRRARSSQNSSNHDASADDQPQQNISYASISFTAAPMPQVRTPRSQPRTRPPTPERMVSSSSEERSQEFGSFNRGHGG